MRLTCPNCGAQYEVPDDVIPEAGRDVQCSNCGDTWFQTHRDHPADEAADADQADDWEEVTPEPDTPEAPAEDAAQDPAPEAGPDAASDADPAPAPLPETERPERREIDPAVANVLREEAEREKRARAAAQGGLETQPDLGLGDGQDEARRTREVRARMARMRGEEDQEAASADEDAQGIDPTSRRSLFPDIEEINSSLGPGDDPQGAGAAYDAYPDAAAAQRGGFRRGFLIAVLIAVILLLIYIFAVPLGNLMPSLQDVLADYAAWVDGLRVWLDGQIAALMLWLDGMASGAPEPAGDSTGN
ncbi:hypothetical protein DC366_14665 [Pelagivirga sediminicola]|uniref:Zinc finger/thioredoxin putative domain-containing protein n=1 Tax=Pelagivirga sediminicola TaxID=2170575 RepID=A0A2T7G4K9_9RHOB|nr:zinc-ribbon domain-containing protein [Pelagivirga sediminicola]PVA09358.1 hypothetical protein DC366_14665 [Pelagivirga sediminicola]